VAIIREGWHMYRDKELPGHENTVREPAQKADLNIQYVFSPFKYFLPYQVLLSLGCIYASNAVTSGSRV
jgi:hypothetical protein